ncbi:MAG: glycosyltransferase [Planctomycetaceae bacterium]
MSNARVPAAAFAAGTAGAARVSVIVPTYKEAENLPLLVRRLAGCLEEAAIPAEILVVDDDSPDDTAKVCAALAREFPLRLEVRRHERGLSSAVLHGMRLATGDRFVVMDADLSHPPEVLPALVKALDDPAIDFVIGSRYVEGGTTGEGWGLFRRLNSRVATLLARPLTAAKDPLSGFFALRRETFLRCAELDPVGYKIGLELLVKGRCRGLREIPIRFERRLHGKSKLGLREQVDYLRHLRRLFEFKLGAWAYPIQFAFVGATGMAFDLALFALLLQAIPYQVARLLAIWAAMSWNFALNRRITFSYARKESALRQYLLFCGACGVGAAVNWGTTMLLISSVDFFRARMVLAAAAGVVAGVGFNYLLSRKVVFRLRTRPPADGPGR